MGVIAICGLKRSGKDTIGKYLVDNYCFTRYAFADPIREVCKIIFDWTDEDMELRKEVIDPYWGISPRFAMQWIGTEAFQYYLPQDVPGFSELIGRTIWVKKFIRWHERTKHNNVVITDMRFLHEFSLLKETYSNNVMVLKVYRKATETKDLHASEQDISYIDADYTINNDDDFHDLYSRIDFLLDNLNNM